jgi:hypothetical protein
MSTPCDLDHAAAVTAARHIFDNDFADQLAGGYAATHIGGVVDGFYALFDVQRIWGGGESE